MTSGITDPATQIQVTDKNGYKVIPFFLYGANMQFTDQSKILTLDQKPLKEDDPEDLPKKKKGTAFRLSKKAKREKKYWEHL